MHKIKERVKKGELHPDDAMAILDSAECHEKRHPSKSLLKWLDTTGRKRFAKVRLEARQHVPKGDVQAAMGVEEDA